MAPSEHWGRNVPPTETTRLLSENVRISKETENIDTVLEMERQGEELDETQFKVEDILAMAEAARLSAQTIRFKVYQQRFKLWLGIIAVCIINILLILRMSYNKGALL
ncbi:hypothetical protein B484DRAFT_400425 [Ochromonadaceae sp. CCMP2298]|nr:hypothetical protein B484DRAFT_400425 [Ochromonadaceae sp. CCMP2298]